MVTRERNRARRTIPWRDRVRQVHIWLLGLVAAALLTGCRGSAASAPPAVGTATRQAADTPAATFDATDPAGPADDLNVVIAHGVRDSVDESVIRDAFRRAVAQAEQDYGLRPEHPVTVYVDPDNALGLEDALGLSQKSAIHLRAGQTRNLQALLPLMMHEYTHVLQYQSGRLRPQWWVEGQADFQSLRLRDMPAAERERRALYSRLSDDVRSGRAPKLSTLRGGIGWDEYIKKAGAGKAYGWGNVAVAFIEDRGGFAAVARIMTDGDGPNTLGRFDDLVRDATGLGPEEFDAALKQWVVQKARG